MQEYPAIFAQHKDRSDVICVYLEHVFLLDSRALQQPKSAQSLSHLGNYVFNVSVPFKVIANYNS